MGQRGASRPWACHDVRHHDDGASLPVHWQCQWQLRLGGARAPGAAREPWPGVRSLRMLKSSPWGRASCMVAVMCGALDSSWPWGLGQFGCVGISQHCHCDTQRHASDVFGYTWWSRPVSAQSQVSLRVNAQLFPLVSFQRLGALCM
jgi:hypothetical protein